ncbi:glutamate--tRNA ligase [Candidatus Lokiarchaeum ossiferum]|uniref:glutamate--tRNA ligase n=1 Tax=Candidatus Lokiarchaeum ossiferum TaxID=2951803 RepID=UPI00352DAC3D
MNEVEKIIWLEGLKNAVKFKGKANAKAVMGKLMRDMPELRTQGKEVKIKIFTIIKEINQLDQETQAKKALELDPHALDEKEKAGPEEKVLPELPGAENGKVVMRLAPYPSGALHVGNARMCVLNDEYVKRYNGKLLLVFDDTIGTTLEKINEPNAKYVIPEAYDLIPEGLDWLGVKYHETHYKSDRVEYHQKEAGNLIDRGEAYVCTCEAQVFRDEFKRPGKNCPCRSKDLEHHQELYDQMKSGKIGEGDAVVRLKTGMDQKDPAMRDHIIMRISDAPHPRIGTKVRLWPVLEWSWGLDDHFLGITHIIRGIDLKKEGEVEKYIWDLYGWKHSHISLYGRLKFGDEFKFSKTQARQNVRAGIYDGFGDPRTWSLQSLEARGIHPDSVRQSLIDLGMSNRGIEFDKNWIYSYNTKLIDADSNRYWFVENPKAVKILDIPMDKYVANPLLNPQFPEKGTRNVPMGINNHQCDVFMASADLDAVINHKGKVLYPAITEGQDIRFKDMFNVKIESIDENITARYLSSDKIQGIRKIQVVPELNNIPIKILQPDGIVTEGFGESNLRTLKPGTSVQFERYGYVKLRDISPNNIYGYFTN